MVEVVAWFAGEERQRVDPRLHQVLEKVCAVSHLRRAIAAGGGRHLDQGAAVVDVRVGDLDAQVNVGRPPATGAEQDKLLMLQPFVQAANHAPNLQPQMRLLDLIVGRLDPDQIAYTPHYPFRHLPAGGE